MAGEDNASSRRFQEHFDCFRDEVEKLCQSLYRKLQHEAQGFAIDLEQRSKELDAKAEQLARREHVCSQLEQKTRWSSKPKVTTRNVGIQAGQQSASCDARKLYGDLTAGDITHHDVQLAFVEYFNKHRRSFSGIFLGGTSLPVCNAPCYIFQVAYEQAKEHVLHCFVSELMKLFGNVELEDADILSDKKRCLMMLLDNTKSDRHQAVVGMLGPDTRKVEEQASKLLCDELNQLFVGAIVSDSSAKKVWENRRCSFGLLLHITGIKQSQPHDALKQAILPRLKKYQSKCGALFAKVPTLVEESVKIVWDMVTLNPPAISYLPKKFDENLHEKHFSQWEESRQPTNLVYFNPVLYFGFSLDIAHRGEVGNKSPGHIRKTVVCQSASNGATSVKRVCGNCKKETKGDHVFETQQGVAVCQQCYQQYMSSHLFHCRYCQKAVQDKGGSYPLEGNTSVICKQCYSERFLVCRKCKQSLHSRSRTTVQGIGYSWHFSCLKCYVCHKTITGKSYPHPEHLTEPVCHDCVEK